MPESVIIYGIIFLVIFLVGFKILANLKVILILAIAGFFTYYATNYVVKDKELTTQNVVEKSKKVTNAVSGFENFLNDMNSSALTDDSLERAIKREQHQKRKDMAIAHEKFQKQLAEARLKQAIKDRKIIDDMRNAKIW